MVPKVGIIGLGTVGGGVVKLLSQQEYPIKLVKVADINPKRFDNLPLPKYTKKTQNAWEIIEDENIKIVVELIGGEEPALTYIKEALRKGKIVVTANKALLAEKWEELKDLEEGSLFYEAAIGGGIPIVRAIKESFVGERIKLIYGILNGTSNYILTKMQEGEEFESALQEAKRYGYAEADPALDIEGIDTLHKIILLSKLAYSFYTTPASVYKEGIKDIKRRDIIYAEEFRSKIKLLGIARKISDNEIYISVYPVLLAKTHPLANVDGEYNAIYLEGESLGPQLFYGKGAGELPTARAVISDIIAATKNIDKKLTHHYLEIKSDFILKQEDDMEHSYYIRFMAEDKPGVLASIAKILAENKISIASVIQKERGRIVPVVMLTHEAKFYQIKEAINRIDKLDVIREKSLVLRCLKE